jgi:phage shock protein A
MAATERLNMTWHNGSGGFIMALITRISRLFKADFHAVLDQVEDPGTLLRQAIREMEDDLCAAELCQRQTHDEKDKLEVRRGELEQALGEIDEELDVCFESEEDQLARDLIKRKLQSHRLLKHLSTHLATVEKDMHLQRKSLEEKRAKLESMRQKAELFAERSPKNGSHRQTSDHIAWSPHELSVSDSDVEVAFLRERKRRIES